jgi:hypothetical protein
VHASQLAGWLAPVLTFAGDMPLVTRTQCTPQALHMVLGPMGPSRTWGVGLLGSSQAGDRQPPSTGFGTMLDCLQCVDWTWQGLGGRGDR